MHSYLWHHSVINMIHCAAAKPLPLRCMATYNNVPEKTSHAAKQTAKYSNDNVLMG